jgi:hypothetical protein
MGWCFQRNRIIAKKGSVPKRYRPPRYLLSVRNRSLFGPGIEVSEGIGAFSVGAGGD